MQFFTNICGSLTGCMETNIYGLVQIRLYFKPVWLKIGIVRQIIVEASKIEFRKKGM
jgi:hypothetical protein